METRFDLNHPPYDTLTTNQRLSLQKALDIVFFDDDEDIIRPLEKIDYLYIVIKGRVKEVGTDGEIVALYRQNDTFEARALIEGSSRHRFVVQEQALLYRLPKASVLAVMEENPRFGLYFYAGVAEKLAQLSDARHDGEFHNLFNATVGEAYRRASDKLCADQSALSAAEFMKQQRVKSVLVEDKTTHHIGLLTESRFRDMMIDGITGDTPIRAWVAFDLVSVDIGDFIFHALLLMNQHQVQRVVVTENGAPVGFLEQMDVLAYFSNHSYLITQQLERATRLDELPHIAAQMHQSIQILHQRGMRAPQLAQLIQTLNSALFEKAWRLIAPPEVYANSCLIIMGSEGRGEQILKTDQDNGLILRNYFESDAVRQSALRFNAFLNELGYPPCAGGIMVSNPQWCQSALGYQALLSRWVRTPKPDAMMQLAIFIDAKAVAGDASLLDEVRDHLQQQLGRDSALYMNFASAIDLFEGQTQGFFAQWLSRSDDRMDLKKLGIFPIVHGVRALSLKNNITVNNTFERLRHLAQKQVLNEALCQDTAEALAYLMQLRLKFGLHQHAEEISKIEMSQLSTLERDLLKDALQVVKRFRNAVRQYFHLGGV